MKTLLADPATLKLEKIVLRPGVITVHVRTSPPATACPSCHKVAARVHSRYTRQVADLPWEGICVRLMLRTRKFFCSNEVCMRQVFCERLPSVVAPYGRATLRLEETFTLIGLALGGRPGQRASAALGMSTSAETLLRRVRQRARNLEAVHVRVLGVDDWAKRKGRSYGTLLIDVERSCPLEMLADRDAGTLAAWLKSHKEVEVVTRDRASYYADGAKEGAPQALQVADRFHLVNNLHDVVERIVNRHRRRLREVSTALNPYRLVNEALHVEELPELRPKRKLSPLSKKELTLRHERRAQRVERWEEVRRLRAEGNPVITIARKLGMQRATVRMFMRADEYPEARSPGIRPSKVKPFEQYLKKRWLEGCHNGRQLYREIRKQGYDGSVKVLQAYLEPWRKLLPEEIRRMTGVPEVAPPAPRRVTWWLLKQNDELRDEERAFVSELITREPVLKEGRELTHEFRRMVSERDGWKLDEWFERVAAGELTEFKSFAKGLREDEAAVRAALTLGWSNGMTEGHINRLKTIKRQMYGRAKDDLLRARVLLAA